jgi:hypothetical protein
MRKLFGRCLWIAALFLLTAGCSREEAKTTGAGTSVHTFTNFASELVLDSYANTELRGHTFLVLTWRAVDDKPRDAYTVFVHAIDKEGKILFQFDHALLNARGMPTSLWKQEAVKDVFQITPPAGHAPGKCTLRIGLYVARSGRFVEVFTTDLPTPTDGWRDRGVLLPDLNCR